MNYYKEALEQSPYELLENLKNFLVEVPAQINTIDEMNIASNLLLRLASNYSYLCGLAAYAELETRRLKREGEKTEYEDAIDRKKVVSKFCDAVHQQYQAISRAITVHTENNNELKMSM